MGLSLCYELRFAGDVTAARRVLAELQQFAKSLDFSAVSDIVELGAPDGSEDDQDELSPEHARVLTILGSQYGQKTMRDGTEVWIDIPPKHVIAFGINPAEGSETAQFGLATHPAVVEHVHQDQTLIIETGLTGRFSWTQCCKTQYAGLQQHGGASNFLFAHVGLVRCLDHLITLGVDVDVKDDSGYWEHRDEARLRQSLTEWNHLIAAFAGQLKDQLGGQADHGIKAPILTAPDFEHLEAKGLRAWTSPDPNETSSED